MVQQNKEIVTRWFEECYEGNPDIIDELGADDMVLSYPMTGRVEGRESVKKVFLEYRRAFPDLSIDMVGDLVAEGDYVVSRWEVSGTHTGATLGNLPVAPFSLPAASGKKIRWAGTSVLRIENGKIVEEIGQEDALTALQQLGFISQK